MAVGLTPLAWSRPGPGLVVPVEVAEDVGVEAEHVQEAPHEVGRPLVIHSWVWQLASRGRTRQSGWFGVCSTSEVFIATTVTGRGERALMIALA